MGDRQLSYLLKGDESVEEEKGARVKVEASSRDVRALLEAEPRVFDVSRATTMSMGWSADSTRLTSPVKTSEGRPLEEVQEQRGPSSSDASFAKVRINRGDEDEWRV